MTKQPRLLIPRSAKGKTHLFKNCSFVLVLVLTSCAPHRAPTPSLSTSVPPESFAYFTGDQLLGLEEIPGLVADPDTGERALPEVIQAYEALKEKAQIAGWRLFISSGYRSFRDQTGIWNRYFKELSQNKRLSEKRLVLRAMKYKNI